MGNLFPFQDRTNQLRETQAGASPTPPASESQVHNGLSVAYPIVACGEVRSENIVEMWGDELRKKHLTLCSEGGWQTGETWLNTGCFDLTQISPIHHLHTNIWQRSMKSIPLRDYRMRMWKKSQNYTKISKECGRNSIN